MQEEIIRKLRNRLKGELPGLTAQMKMAPFIRKAENFTFTKKDNSIQGGVLILLYPHLDELYIPLMLRSEYGGAHSGQVSFPGGKKERSDKNLIETALRESEEELGIPSHRVEILGTLSDLFISVSNFNVLPVIGYIKERPDFRKDPHEVDELIEAPISHLLLSTTSKIKNIKVPSGFELEAPYYQVERHSVWGATAMMLSEFLAIYKDL